MKFVFVILHYKNIEDTIECIESIMKLNYNNKSIIVVDNFSNNGSGEKLNEIYTNNDSVKIVINNKNLGFAKGNNIGIKIAIKDEADFICLINNDTIIKQKDFIEKCIQVYKEKSFYICGPKIVSLIDEGNQNPFIVPNHFISSKRKALRLYVAGIVKYITFMITKRMWWEKEKRKNLTNNLENKQLDSFTDEFLLHGACMIFSPKYLKKYNKICDLTFMYEEETIIYLIAKKLNLKMIYCPQIEIYHKEESATRKIYKSENQKLKFGIKQDMKSRRKVLKIALHMNNKLYLERLLGKKHEKRKDNTKRI